MPDIASVTTWLHSLLSSSPTPPPPASPSYMDCLICRYLAPLSTFANVNLSGTSNLLATYHTPPAGNIERIAPNPRHRQLEASAFERG